MNDQTEASCWAVAVRAVFVLGAVLIVASYVLGSDATVIALR